MDINRKTEQSEVRDYEEVDQALEVQNEKKLDPLVERKKEVFQEQKSKRRIGHRSALTAPKGASVVSKDNSALGKGYRQSLEKLIEQKENSKRENSEDSNIEK
ncbi:16952_t:CDS:2, partial [Gigaspora margarita]